MLIGDKTCTNLLEYASNVIKLTLISFSLLVKYEPGVLEACLNLLQVSPRHQKNTRLDYLNRNNPVYISRVVSAMVSVKRFRVKA